MSVLLTPGKSLLLGEEYNYLIVKQFILLIGVVITCYLGIISTQIWSQI